MKGEVVEVVHGDRAVFQMMVNRSSRMYKREDVRLDPTKMYQEDEEEKVNNQQMGTELEARKDHKFEVLEGTKEGKVSPQHQQRSTQEEL